MKKTLSLKKLTHKELKQINGAGRMICCQTYCDTGECALWGQLPAMCPIVIPCI